VTAQQHQVAKQIGDIDNTEEKECCLGSSRLDILETEECVDGKREKKKSYGKYRESGRMEVKQAGESSRAQGNNNPGTTPVWECHAAILKHTNETDKSN
jgi:hypothetical protein